MESARKLIWSNSIAEKDVEKYRDSKDLTWHEENDMVHQDLLSSDVNGVYQCHLLKEYPIKMIKKHV